MEAESMIDRNRVTFNGLFHNAHPTIAHYPLELCKTPLSNPVIFNLTDFEFQIEHLVVKVEISKSNSSTQL